MKAGSRLLAVSVFLVLTGLPASVCRADDAKHPVANVYTPFPPYPYIARRNREQGFGLVLVTFGAAGSVSDAKMKLSTGHPDLDDNVLQFARSHWRGPANARGIVPVDYRLVPYGTSFNRNAGPDGWYTPLPSYPTLSRRFLERGSGVIKVSTDASGRTVHAEMIKSIGYARLDEVTTQYALAYWKGPPKSSKTIPVHYAMPMGSPGPN